MSGRSKVLAPVATVVAVAAVAVTASLFAGGDGPRSPRALRLADSASTAKDSAGALGAPQSPASGGYRVTGTLPQGTPDDAPAWTLPDGPGSVAPVARLADALKLGTPTRDGQGWTAGGLRVSGDAGRAWYFYPCGPDTAVSSDGPVACAVARGSGGGSTGIGSVSAGTVTAEPAPPPDQPNEAPAPPADKPATSPPWPPGQEPVSSPGPAPKTPSEQAVRAAAAPILDALDLQDQTARVTAYAGGGSVVVDPVVAGMETSGWATRVDVDQDAKVVGASGWLADPSKADSYPLVTAQAAFDALPERPHILSCEMSPDGGCKEPAPVEITGAHLGLTVAALADGGLMLLPAWLFDVKGADEPVAGVAVQPKYLSTGDPTEPSPGTGPGTEPGSGGTDPSAGKPTQVDPVPPQSSRSPLSFDSAYRASTKDAVVVQYGDSGSCPHTGVTHQVKEDATAVYVFLEADAMDPGKACTDDYRAMKVQIALQSALGDRKVIDGATGRTVPLS